MNGVPGYSRFLLLISSLSNKLWADSSMNELGREILQQLALLEGPPRSFGGTQMTR